MEAQWIADRAALRTLAARHPTWGPTQLAHLLGYSRSWVKKWLKRLREAPPHDAGGSAFSFASAPHASSVL